MSATATPDDSTGPEYTDAEVREAAVALHDLVENDRQLSLVCNGTYAQQLDNPLTDDQPTITLFMDGEAGSGATKATIIQTVLDSDVPVALENTSEGHGQITFRVNL